MSAELTQTADAEAPAALRRRAGVVGASGILGGELLRILVNHPGIELEYVSAQSRAGRSATELNPHLKDAGIGEFEAFDARVAAKRCDVVFLATPPETAGRAVPELLDAGAELVVDLSPAYRVRDPELHRQWYPDVERDQQIAEVAAYALPELSRAAAAEDGDASGGAAAAGGDSGGNGTASSAGGLAPIGREAIRAARVLAVPGCFATAILLAALPLRELEGVTFDSVAIDGKSGSTGSGARLRESGAHTWRSNVVAPYAPRGHRHVAEVGEAFADVGVSVSRLGMSTYGVDLVRGLSVGLYSFFEGELDERALRRAYHRTYRDERFVRVQAGRGSALPLPDPKAVIGSNFCDVAGFVDEAASRFVLIGAIDNMVKGGAGQAVQACNLRLGLPEDAGLEAIPVFPV
ncbi:MAG TPA: NAD(P)-binding domain-containing protein [Thermoleophilaceae bacterium]|nr:NAD(P)-binding domain-containing protein [Thermoleophilaceae bacterium]